MKIISKNRKAFHDYSIDSTIEAGIVLTGAEVKSVRLGHVNLTGSFGTITRGELFLLHCYIGPYDKAALPAQDEKLSRRTRKLLVNKRELIKLTGLVSRKGITLVPLSIYISDAQRIKIELGIARHKKAAVRKEELRERDIQRETRRELKGS